MGDSYPMKLGPLPPSPLEDGIPARAQGPNQGPDSFKADLVADEQHRQNVANQQAKAKAQAALDDKLGPSSDPMAAKRAEVFIKVEDTELKRSVAANATAAVVPDTSPTATFATSVFQRIFKGPKTAL